MAEFYKIKEYKNTKSFITACGKAMSEILDGYPDDELSTEYYNDGRSIEQCLIEDDQFSYNGDGIAIDLIKDIHIYVWREE